MFFVFGAALAHSADGLAARQPNWLATTVLLAGLACLWLSTEPAVMAGGSVLIVLAAVLPGRIRRTLNHPWLRWLGRISYSLYLTHLLVLLSAAHLLAAMLPMKVILAGVAVTALVFAAGFQRLVEAPSDRLGRRLTRGFALPQPERTAPQIVEPPSLRQRVGAALAGDEAMERLVASVALPGGLDGPRPARLQGAQERRGIA
jgi:peptidoglycan/LPS O-acetylase OafA/YrhL